MTLMIQILKKQPLIPIITIHHVYHALPLVEALIAAGINTIEITLRTIQAVEAIEIIKTKHPHLTIGAGAITSIDQLQLLQSLHIDFIVSPGCTPKLADQIQRTRIPYLPAASTVSEMMVLQDMGFSIVNFFPAQLAGGAKMLEALAVLVPNLSYYATGGISINHLKTYANLQNVIAIGANWITPIDSIEKQHWNVITHYAKEALAIMNTTKTEGLPESI